MCETKKCSKCGGVYPIASFSRKKSNKDGRQSSCKECCAKYYADNREKMLERAKQYQKDNRDRVSAANAEYYIKNKQRILESKAAWRKANPEIAAARQAAWSKANPEKWTEYYAKNREAISERMALYYTKFPERKNAHRLVRAAIRDGLLEPPETCQICASTSCVEYHHPDYSKPLEVIPLCRSCHRLLHSGIRQLPVTGLNVGVDFPANQVWLITVGPSLL